MPPTSDIPSSDALPRRRRFLAAGVALPAAGVLAAHQHAAAQQPVPMPAAAAAAIPAPAAYVFFTAPEAAAIEAWVDELIPADALGPGALAAGVPFFIDRQLAGAFGAMQRAYRQGPWRAGTPQQGWQSALTPAEFCRAGLAALRVHCEAALGQPFEQLPSARRVQVLTALERGELPLAEVPAATLFELVHALAFEGFFADPAYGGNRDKAGWRLVGYPGAAAAYLGVIELHGQPYRVQPASLADLQSGTVDSDGVGHAIHKPVA